MHNISDEDRALTVQMALECERMKDEPPAPVLIPRLAALALITQVQLALRHPENKGWNACQGESLAKELQSLFDPDSATYRVLEKGWHKEFDVEVLPVNTVGKTEVHNAYAFYELDERGNEVEEKSLSFFRPQDWGNQQRWHYHYCRIELDRYVNHCHVWQEVHRNPIEAMQAIAPHLFLILIPGHPRELCDRSHIEAEDFWLPEWGEQPPVYIPDDDDDF